VNDWPVAMVTQHLPAGNDGCIAGTQLCKEIATLTGSSMGTGERSVPPTVTPSEGKLL
jgi:hypothetical protein